MKKTLEERFWQKVDKSGECWEWMAGHNKAGHGRIWHPVRKRLEYAHRLSYEWAKGPIPDGLLIRHKCDNPSCVNPDHLTIGTQVENMADAACRGRMPSGNSHHNSKLTEFQVESIRRLRQYGMLYGDIARFFPVGKEQVRRIATGIHRAVAA